ncbi:SNF2 family N-terminal domain-containing protein [Microdochium trichocladiopsis]|uniref:SNF2 family N-terminal domain-containing protein n=1 Tax=Microdochium trichocladiopsis TaxID=1682393 RepID=A0A9P9BTX7_9PEZI|nr:SNF2 family N-terminal domain-containing protein [Microdochium trichocladiopsis]KAH7030904.1 SNF2 family N-terminal domain-containing protein [Microdochium trichocladiopsis]
MVRSKRPAEVIDLTGSESPKPKYARHDTSQISPPNYGGPAHPAGGVPSSSARSAFDDDDDSLELTMTQADDSNTPQMELYGSFEGKIVGVRYYHGVVTPGEMILCRREANNQYDPNAIRIDNVMRRQIGHLPRTLVKKLAPYIDNNEIVIEGVLTGEKGAFECPIRVYVYGTSNAADRLTLEDKLKADKILKATDMKNTRKQAETMKKAAKLGFKSSTVDTVAQQEHDESLQDLLGRTQALDARTESDLLKTFAMDEETLSQLPKAEQPLAIHSKLLPYQLQGLAWMIAKEEPQLPSPQSNEIVQLWKRDKRGHFLNLATGFTTTEKPALLSGGILSDDMGLGKTIQIISLILSQSSNQPGPTLIIAPKGVMSNWEEQVFKHVHPNHTPRILRYHRGGNHTAKDFRNHDIVISSYGKLASDFKSARKDGLFSLEWRRVVLDEGHIIRTPTTTCAKAAYDLKAKSRWVLTGTPIVNKLKDFQSLLRFLRISGGIEDPMLFNTVIGRPIEGEIGGEDSSQEYRKAESLLQALSRDLCLRRLKHMGFVDLKLPEKTERIFDVEFNKDEKVKYDAMLSQAKGALQEYEARSEHGQKMRFANVLERLLRLRQLCNHWTLCGDRVKDILSLLDDQNVVQFSEENLQILQTALHAAVDDAEECAVCYDAIDTPENLGPVITACKHIFCKKCLTQAIAMKPACPMCRTHLTPDLVVDFDPSFKDPEDNVSTYDAETESSKTEAIKKLLQITLKDPKSKVVIFSQWTSFLNIIEHTLRANNFRFSRIDGSMTTEKRDSAVTSLNEDPESRVLLASLSVCSVGLNLVAADTVILADSWWAPATEDQAVARVHRLGQTREVRIWRLIVKGSIEERVLGIQAEKRELVGKAFRDKPTTGQTKQVSLNDVRKVLGG